jgi:myosin heavy subunit
MEQCAGRRDALAKTVYAALFEWVVAQVNAAFTVEEVHT